MKLGWRIERGADGRAMGAAHPDGRTAVFVGDLVDRGPDTPGVLRLVMGMVGAGTALCVAGNHEDKLLRKLCGRNVTVNHGLAETLAQLSLVDDPDFTAALPGFLDSLISHYVLDGGRLVVAHARLEEEYQWRASGRFRSFCLYGDTSGDPWAARLPGAATVVYGHTATLTPEWVNNTIRVDTGCVFGGSLTAVRYPSRELVSVPAASVYYEPARPLTLAEPVRASGLSIADVAGRRAIDLHCGWISRAPVQRPGRLPYGRRRPGRAAGEAHGLARGRTGAPRRVRRLLHPYGPGPSSPTNRWALRWSPGWRAPLGRSSTN